MNQKLGQRSQLPVCHLSVLGLTVLLTLGLAFSGTPDSSADVLFNTGGDAVGINQASIVCEMVFDYDAQIPPNVDPVVVTGIITKDDSGGLAPARIGSVTWNDGLNPPVTFNRGDLIGLTPAHEELDNLQVNRVEIWALPFITVPDSDTGNPATVEITYIDSDGNPLIPTESIAGCGLYTGVAQDRPVTGHGGGDIGAPGTDLPYSFLPCSKGGLSIDAIAVNGDIDFISPLPGSEQTVGLEENTGFTSDDLNCSSSRKALTAQNCTDDLVAMAWNLDQATTWVAAAISLEPEDDCYVGLKLDRNKVDQGGRLEVEFALRHNRWQTVVVPLKFWIEDEAGNRLLDVTTAPRTFKHNDMLRKTFNINIPANMAPGRYRLATGADKMEQGFGWADKWFTVTEKAQ